ncbi:MAG: DUF5916 domain-containing protein [Acidobacteria bacterium]|nr:DUF5916 domain-containing protein [Acidobacteriota bacterium]
MRILFDTHHIYFGVICYDSNPAGIRATELRRDNSLENDDIFELILDTFHDRRNGYLFRINPLGTLFDATVTNEGQTYSEDSDERWDANWDEKWEAQTQINGQGWSAEIAIPFKSVRFLSGDRIVWGVNFHRSIKRKNEDVFWTAHNRDFRFVEVSRAGQLEGLAEIQGFTLRLKPFFTTGGSQMVRGGRKETENLTKIGIEDAKYLITSQLALDLTVNPDFAQAEVDEAQVNLTRFNLFFPEKREFFQEGAGIFLFGTGRRRPWEGPQVLLFHSRRIGLSEGRDAEEIPILGGLKLTGQQGPLEIGLLNMQTRRSGETPGQNFAVVRVKGNILARSYVGAIFTRNTAGLSGNDNKVAGVDASFTFFRNLNLRGFLAKGGSADQEDRKWAGLGRMEWNSDRLGVVLERLTVPKEENFIAEAGFLTREDMKRNLVKASYKPRPDIALVRQFQFTPALEYITNLEGELETREALMEWATDFESGDAIEFEFSRFFERLVRPFRIRGGGGTVPPGDYSFNEFRTMFQAFRGRKVSGDLRIETGGFFNGSRTSIGGSVQLKPSQNLSLDPGYEWNRISLPDTSFSTLEFNSQVNYSFSQKWLTRTTFLLDSQGKEYTVNFRLNYIFRPGDDLFVVYNETRSYGSIGGLLNRALIVKLTYSLDY